MKWIPWQHTLSITGGPFKACSSTLQSVWSSVLFRFSQCTDCFINQDVGNVLVSQCLSITSSSGFYFLTLPTPLQNPLWQQNALHHFMFQTIKPAPHGITQTSPHRWSMTQTWPAPQSHDYSPPIQCDLTEDAHAAVCSQPATSQSGQ